MIISLKAREFGEKLEEKLDAESIFDDFSDDVDAFAANGFCTSAAYAAPNIKLVIAR